MTQNERIIRHLRDFGSITPVEAMRDYGIMRLASRIHDIKASGTKIDTRMVSGKNRYGEATSYAVYTLRKGERPNA